MFRNGKLKVIALTSLAIFAMGGTVFGTFAWFQATTHNDAYNMSGRSAGAYFAYGNGYDTTDPNPRPFGISTPRHLYNLAWLHYMGQFDDRQYYFELADSIPDEGLDMTGYILPPIGTEDNPFVSNFNGNGKIIKNLTVATDESVLFSSTNKHPDSSQVSYTAPEIVGMFGVVGNLDGAYTGTYDRSTNKVYNLGITDFTIKTSTAKALVGVCAGYVDATISNVAVNDSAIDVGHSSTAAVDDENLTGNVSDYGVIGYATANYRKSIKEIQQDLYDISIVSGKEFNATESGDATGWGGSVNMTDLFNRLLVFKTDNNFGTTANYDYKETRTYNPERTSYTTSNVTSGTNMIRYYNTDEKVGSYQFGNRNNTNYMYLTGGKFVINRYRAYRRHTGTKITYKNSNDTLTITNFQQNSGTLGNTDGDKPVLWSVPNGNSGYISATYYYNENNSTTYYLRNNGGTLSLTTQNGQRTTWYKSTDANGNVRYSTQQNGGYYIMFNGSNWVLNTMPTAPTQPSVARPTTPVAQPTEPTLPIPVDPAEPVEPTEPAEPVEPVEPPLPGTEPQEPSIIPQPTNYGYQIIYNDSGTNRFLVPNGTNGVTSSTTPFNGGWNYSNNRLTTTIGGTTYYLTHSDNNLSISRQDNDAGWNNNNNKFSYTVSGTCSNTTYYLKYNNGFTIAEGDDLNTFTREEWSLCYDGQYRTKTDAQNQYDASVAQHNAWQTEHDGWQEVKDTHDAWVTDHATWVTKHAEWETEHAAWETEHAAWETEHAAWVVEHNQYLADKAEYDAAWTQYNNDLTAYNNYLEAVRLWNNYDAAMISYNNQLANTYQIKQTVISNPNYIEGPDSSYIDNSQTEAGKMVYDQGQTTCFPLNVVADGTQSDITKYYPKSTNTGYITVGSNINANYTWPGTGSSQTQSNMRVSKYTISKINGSYTPNNGFSTIYTLNDSNQVVPITDSMNLQKFDDSLESLGEILSKDTDNVFGLHFMPSQISINDIYTSKYAMINGVEHQNYQFPVNSIDFNLKEKGYINFFAGMYFVSTEQGNAYDNDSLFSLHQIIRNNDGTIAQIKEIKEIYSDGVSNHSIIYKYTDNKYSAGYEFNSSSKIPLTPGVDVDAVNLDTLQGGYTLAFKTERITNYSYETGNRINNNFNGTNHGNKIFYFEMPMNAGEFCLGSVANGTGGYLFYLDIGANASKTQRTIIYERYNEIKKVIDYPIGIAVVSVSTVADNLVSGDSLDDTNTSNFLIRAGSNGKVTISRSGNDITLSRSGGLLTSAKPTLEGDLMWDSTYQVYNIHGPDSSHPEGDVNLTYEITSTNTTTEYRRLQYYDWNVNLSELVITRITDESTDGGSTWTRSFYQETQNSSGTTSTTTVGSMRIYNTDTGVKFQASELTNPSTSTVKTYQGATPPTIDSYTLIFSLTYEEDAGEDVTHEWLLEMVLDPNSSGKYYIFQDYVFSATVSSGSVTLKVVSLGSKPIKINSTPINSVGQTVTITP